MAECRHCPINKTFVEPRLYSVLARLLSCNVISFRRANGTELLMSMEEV